MSELYGHYDAVEGSPNYPSARFSQFVDMISRDIMPDYLNELLVAMVTGLQTSVDTGGMISQGRYYINTSGITLTHDAEAAGSKRKDNIVVEFNTATGVNVVKIHKGIGTTGTPSAPALVDTSNLWEKLLAVATIEGGVVTAVTDGRLICGARRTGNKFGTSATPPAGIYPAGTLYARHEE